MGLRQRQEVAAPLAASRPGIHHPKAVPDFPLSTKNTGSKRPDSSPGSAGQLVFPLPLWLSGETGVRVLFSSLAWMLPHGGLIPSSCAI